MNESAPHPVLNTLRLPARVDASAAAALLGFKEYDLKILASEKLLVPLGKPGKNSPKYFSSAEITALANDRKWLDKATKAIGDTYAERNAKYKSKDKEEQKEAA